MADRMSDDSDDRRPARGPGDDERFTSRDEWAPGDAAPGHRVPGEPRPGERLPGEPAPAGSDGRLPGSAGPGREGLTGDDRTPEDTPAPPPGPAGMTASPGGGTGAGTGAGQRPGTERLRPGTEDLGPGTDEGFTASHRTERAAISEEDRMPENGLGAPSPGVSAARESATTDAPSRDTWPAAPGGSTASDGAPGAGAAHTPGATVASGGEPVAGGARTSGGTAATGTTGGSSASGGAAAPLLAPEEAERWEGRIREVVGGFVDEPRAAVEQADRALEEIAARFSEAVTRRRRTLRASWEGPEESGPAAGTDTEQLRLALRDYRELAGRLLHG
ncbi:hypothetical protein ACFY8B_30120 [Streptomyces sp. NPDC012751]|uniref:hypothetical protein n=1 Tax=Streptomyces sp. NPDC012751 TaxID=3364846 RepID=UPI0036C903A9